MKSIDFVWEGSHKPHVQLSMIFDNFGINFGCHFGAKMDPKSDLDSSWRYHMTILALPLWQAVFFCCSEGLQHPPKPEDWQKWKVFTSCMGPTTSNTDYQILPVTQTTRQQTADS